MAKGRKGRWFALFVFAVGIVLSAVFKPLAGLFYIAVLIPNIAVGIRRLHDIGRSGWWLLLSLIPVLGWIALLILMVQPGRTQVTPI